MDKLGIAAIVYLLSCHIVLATSVFLIFDKRYEEGLFGHIALVVLVIACALVMMDYWFGAKWWGAFSVNPVNAGYAFGTALFMLRHALRFWKFRWRCPIIKGEERVVPYA